MRASAKHKREMRRLILKIEAFFNKERYYPRGHLYLDKVVLAHVSKGLNVAKAVMQLVDAGLPEEAFGLSRTLLEVALNLRFITNRNSERRAQRFAQYWGRWHMELIKRTLKHFYTIDAEGKRVPKYSKAELSKMMGDYTRSMKLARKYPRGTSWLDAPRRKSKKARVGRKTRGRGVWMIANEPDKYEQVEGMPLTWNFDYDWIYFWTSQYVHASVVSMLSHAAAPGEPFSIDAAPTRDVENIAVFNVGAYLVKILIMAFRAIGHTFDSDLADQLWKLLVSMRKRDRTLAINSGGNR